MIGVDGLERMCGLVEVEDITAGATFYHSCRVRIAELADDYGFPLAAAVGAFAALSPNSNLAGNFRSLASVMDAARSGLPEKRVRVASYNRGRRAAMRLLSGEEEFADVCSGPKITAFRHNLLYPMQSARVTIDGHMIALIFGEPEMTMRQANMAVRRIKGADAVRYGVLERVFLRLVKRRPLGELPVPTYQSILWFMRRRRAGFSPVKIPAEVRPYEAME